MTETPGAPPEPSKGPHVDPLALSPFTRLARTHAFSVAGDALFAIGLAGTIFFLSPTEAARTEVALYLVLTIAPFAVVAPLIGPALDRIRGGRRLTILGAGAGRALVCFLLVQHLDGLLLYPEAFLMLVFSKAYHISKSAIVPTTVRSDAELVEANAKLSLISGIAVAAAAIPGGLLTWLAGPEWVVALGGVVFVVMSISALRLPRTVVAAEPADAEERAELHSRVILLAASGMGLLRGVVGFLAFLLAFAYKDEGAWRLGVVAGAAQIGFLAGSVLSPRLRKLVIEEYILIGSLLTVCVVGVGAAFTGGVTSAALLSFTVGTASSCGKQAFDAIVQRDAPDANRGRSFARFETRFQVVWVLGALIPVVISMPLQLGFGVIAVATAAATASYLLGIRGISLDAGAKLRAWRRRRRVGADEESARRLGLGDAVAFEEEPASPSEPEPGVSDARPEAPASPPSPAAQAAARRREEREARRRAEREAEAARTAQELSEAEQALRGEETEPDLDWHPQA